MDSWCHVVVTYTNKRQVNLYVNGQLQASEELQGAVKALRDFSKEEKLEWRIGSNMIASVNSFRGSVDEISQYNRELSADEVRILYEAVR